jgi:hypothetical protein
MLEPPPATLRNGSPVEILNFIDDHSRLCLPAARSRSRPLRLSSPFFYDAAANYGFRPWVLSDNGVIFTASVCGDRGAPPPSVQDAAHSAVVAVNCQRALIVVQTCAYRHHAPGFGGRLASTSSATPDNRASAFA